ncbi:MAG: hypothetical protein PHS09_04095 [Candidatus Omnitrophica bacterium]|jgi:uncharacterized protein (UPF0333 family)|nr:hypothetical protein [Candidatus Omnitrophota bacterium]MDD5512869.1 hypothetical protein [Candidatus Omnitrophota bacterium]
MFLRKNKAQSILEYLIILTAIITGFILAKGAIQANTEASLNKVAAEAESVVNAMQFVK